MDSILEDGMSELMTLRVEAGEAGLRLDVFLMRRMEAEGVAVSRASLQKWIKEKRVTLQEKARRIFLEAPDRRCREGDVVMVAPPKKKPNAEKMPAPQKIPLSILFEDKDILILNKQAGLVVHPAPGHREGTLVNALLEHCGASLPGSAARPGIVHRLDKDTSGVMVAAKTDAAYLRLVKLFSEEKQSIERTYLAFARGAPKKPGGIISAPIGRHKTQRQKMAVFKNGAPHARDAQSAYEVLKIYAQGRASLLSCKLLTGRTHQIRLHLAEIGNPVIGDPLYGGKRALPWQFPRQALHAAKLSFPHPVTQMPLSFQVPMPSDMQELEKILEKS